MTAFTGRVERFMARDTWIVFSAVAIIVVLAGLYTALGVGMNMSALDIMHMAAPVEDLMPMKASHLWTWGFTLLIFAMWWMMMVAMMTPSAAPTLLLYTALKRQGTEREIASQLSFLFLLGYLVVWGEFSVLATALHWATERLGVINGPMMTLNSKLAAGSVLLFTGAFQFTSLKASCLKQCSSPAQFLARYRRRGR